MITSPPYGHASNILVNFKLAFWVWSQTNSSWIKITFFGFYPKKKRCFEHLHIYNIEKMRVESDCWLTTQKRLQVWMKDYTLLRKLCLTILCGTHNDDNIDDRHPCVSSFINLWNDVHSLWSLNTQTTHKSLEFIISKITYKLCSWRMDIWTKKVLFVKDYVFPLHSTNEETFTNHTQIWTTYVNETW